MRVLIVDDEADHLRGMKLILMQKGYEVVTATQSKQALELFHKEKDRIDVVITDYMMPEMNGVELLKNMREGCPMLPAILMTAYGDSTMAGTARKNHFDRFIEKPFGSEKLTDEVERLIFSIHQKSRLP